MQFTHYVATEDGVDGGNVQLSVNGGAFAPIPASAYTFNGPKPLLDAATDGQHQPARRAGRLQWVTDAGSVFGSWGESQVDLTAAGVDPGDTIQVRFGDGSRRLRRQRRRLARSTTSRS